ncbi:unnamed protein product [Closterium sp. NIES-64]|nr:unnamed protein product [Closterium sp. NIES-64]
MSIAFLTCKSFGVLILVVLTGRVVTVTAETTAGSMHILPWVDECLSKGDVAGLKSNASMDAPEDVLLRISHLALTCTVARTASRPTMGDVANELQAVRNEVEGKEELIGNISHGRPVCRAIHRAAHCELSEAQQHLLWGVHAGTLQARQIPL